MPKPPYVGRPDVVVPQQTEGAPSEQKNENPNRKPAPKVGKPKGR
jgi:hypothetical protein